MNDLEQAMMNEPNDSTSEDVPSHTERRLLIVVLCLSYLACLAGLWLIGSFPGQAHAVLPGIFGLGQNMRFALRWWAYARLTSGCDTSRARSCSCLRGNWTNASE